MQITIRGKNVAVTPALNDYVEEKVGRLSRYLENISEAVVALSVVKDKHIVEVTVFVNGSGIILRGEESNDDMYASIDLVVEKVERQIRKYKNRLSKKSLVRPDVPALENDQPAKLVKTKRFAIKPMDPEEAVMQMNLIGHDFFVFFNADTEEVNVVYKRKDGNFGLIEPEF
ncbi:MAG: ribosome hibernation-promoting factor, HPF/YfiA family [bacterium]